MTSDVPVELPDADADIIELPGVAGHVVIPSALVEAAAATLAGGSSVAVYGTVSAGRHEVARYLAGLLRHPVRQQLYPTCAPVADAAASIQSQSSHQPAVIDGTPAPGRVPRSLRAAARVDLRLIAEFEPDSGRTVVWLL